MYVRLSGEMVPDDLEPETLEPASEPFGVTDDQWLGVVVLCLADELQCTIREAVDVVDVNRQPCLHCRSMGVEPWELAQFMVEKMEEHWAMLDDPHNSQTGEAER